MLIISPGTIKDAYQIWLPIIKPFGHLHKIIKCFPVDIDNTLDITFNCLVVYRGQTNELFIAINIALFYSQKNKMFIKIRNLLESPCVKATVLHCSLKVGKFKFQPSYYVHFQTNMIGWVLKSPSLIPSAQVNLYHWCSYRRMVLTLNNPLSLILHYSQPL